MENFLNKIYHFWEMGKRWKTDLLSCDLWPLYKCSQDDLKHGYGHWEVDYVVKYVK